MNHTDTGFQKIDEGSTEQEGDRRQEEEEKESERSNDDYEKGLEDMTNNE